jgi:TPR repeat protein
MQSKALINLYLSSLSDLGAKPHTVRDPYKVMEIEDEEQDRKRKQSVMAQMILGNKYYYGYGV